MQFAVFILSAYIKKSKRYWIIPVLDDIIHNINDTEGIKWQTILSMKS